MKNPLLTLSILLLSALFLAGCGKSGEQKQLEIDLNKRVMQMHDAEMAKLDQAKTLDAQLDSAMTMHESVAGKFPKDAAGHTSDDIIQAKEQLAAARSAMDAWMASHKPYAEEMNHAEAMSKMNAEMESLTKVSAQLDTAIAGATATVEAHRQFAQGLMAKKPARRGR
jgi:hypothetical protein